MWKRVAAFGAKRNFKVLTILLYVADSMYTIGGKRCKGYNKCINPYNVSFLFAFS